MPSRLARPDAGVRLEVEFGASASGGDVIITRERRWVGEAAEESTPLQSTGMYVLDGDRILSITRVLDADQRHAASRLMREALVGTSIVRDECRRSPGWWSEATSTPSTRS